MGLAITPALCGRQSLQSQNFDSLAGPSLPQQQPVS